MIIDARNFNLFTIFYQNVFSAPNGRIFFDEKKVFSTTQNCIYINVYADMILVNEAQT